MSSGAVRNLQDVEIALLDGANRCRAFQQIVARGGKDAALGDGSAPVTGAADALQGHGNRARGIDLADQVDRSDIDAEFQRSGGDQQANLAVLQFAFGCQTNLARQAAVMRGYQFFPNAFAQVHRQPLGQPPRVDEDQRGTVLHRQLGEAVVDFAPHFVAGDRAQLRWWNFDGEIELAAMTDVDDRRCWAGRLRSESAQPLQSASASPTVRCASVDSPAARAARAKSSGARRACRRRPREFRRR